VNGREAQESGRRRLRRERSKPRAKGVLYLDSKPTVERASRSTLVTTSVSPPSNQTASALTTAIGASSLLTYDTVHKANLATADCCFGSSKKGLQAHAGKSEAGSVFGAAAQGDGSGRVVE
jgi:hypothetical protein